MRVRGEPNLPAGRRGSVVRLRCRMMTGTSRCGWRLSLMRDALRMPPCAACKRILRRSAVRVRTRQKIVGSTRNTADQHTHRNEQGRDARITGRYARHPDGELDTSALTKTHRNRIVSCVPQALSDDIEKVDMAIEVVVKKVPRKAATDR